MAIVSVERGNKLNMFARLFSLMVAPVVEYTSNVWMHEFKSKNIGPINRVQRVGKSASNSGHFSHSSDQHRRGRGPGPNARCTASVLEMSREDVDGPPHVTGHQSSLQKHDRIRRFGRYHHSPLHQVADALKTIDMESLVAMIKKTVC